MVWSVGCRWEATVWGHRGHCSAQDLPSGQCQTQPPCAQNDTKQAGCKLMSWMGWLGENFWKNQPWRGVGCRRAWNGHVPASPALCGVPCGV